MQLSTKGRYAVMALADLVYNGSDGFVPLSAISARQNISLSYLEQLFMHLRRSGLVVSSRGTCGGYRLSRPPEEISLADIMLAVDEPVKMTRCAHDGLSGCVDGNRCLTHTLWNDLGNHIMDFLKSTYLGDVVEVEGARKQLETGLTWEAQR